MKSNIGGIDRIVRFVIGFAIIIAGFVFQSWWGLVGIIPIFTATINWCPLYLPFGLSTCKTPAAKK